jgi:hypothetical protein
VLFAHIVYDGMLTFTGATDSGVKGAEFVEWRFGGDSTTSGADLPILSIVLRQKGGAA